MKKTFIYIACLTALLLALPQNAGAQGSVGYVQAWDNNDPNPPGDGTWDLVTSNWTSSGIVLGSPVTFTNGNFALFAAASTGSTTNTITIPGPITVAGFGNGSVGGTNTGVPILNLSLSGSGSLNLPAGQWEINCGPVGGFNAGDQIFAQVPITGTGGIIQRDSGSLYLLATNTYSGGTTITGGQILWYNNSNSFGTGPFTNLGTQSLLIAGTPGVVTLSNTFVMNNNGGVMNFGSGQTTLTGPWILKTSPQLKNNGGNTTTVTFAGPISGAFGVFYQCPNAGKITLSGANTYTGVSFIGYSTGTSPETVSVSSINSVANPPQQPSSSLGVPSSVANGTISLGFAASGSSLIYTGAGETSDRVIALTGTTGGATIEMDGAGPLVLTSSFTAPTNGIKTLTLQGTSTATNTIMGAIPNSTATTLLTKAQAGTWVLTGTNTFTGAMAISGGTLVLGGAGELNSGSYAGAIANSGTFKFNSSSNQTLSGVISGAGLLVDTGSGTLTLSGADTFTGGITNSGTLTIGGTGKLAAGSYAGNITNNGTFTYNSSSAQVLSGVISGSGPFVNSGSGVVTLTGLETFTGNITTSSGPLTISNSGSLSGGSYSGNITDNGTFNYNSSASQNLTGTFSGTGSLSQNGPGSLTLSGSTVNYTGSTTVGTSSTLFFTGSGSANATSSLNIAAGGTLDVSGLSSFTYTLSNNPNLIATGTSSAAATINGASSGIVNIGSGPISLTFSPTIFTGDSSHPALVVSQASLTMNANTITVINASGTPLGAGNYVLIQPNAGMSGTVNPNVVVQGSGIAAGLYAQVQIVSGNVILAVQQPSNVSPTWNGNDYAISHNWSHGQNWVGGTPPDATGDQVIFANPSSQTPVMDSTYSVFSVTFNPGTASDILTNSGGSSLWIGAGVTNSSGNPQTFALPINLVELGSPNVASQWDTTGGNITVTSVISDNNTGLSVSGGNTLALNGANTYTGGTTVNASTLSVNNIADGPSSLGSSGTLTLSNGATLTFTGVTGTTARTLTTGMGSATDTINVPGGSQVTFGQVHNSGDSAAQMLTLTGGGTLNLGGTVDNNGLTMAINQGKVVITKSSTSTVHGLGSGVTTIGTGTPSNTAELQLAGTGNFDLFSGCALTVNSPDGFVDLNGQNDNFSTLILSGAGPSGNGALVNNAISTTSSITNGGSAVILTNNTTIGGSGNIRLASAVSGANALTYAGSATLTLAAVGTYTGGTTVNSGSTLQVTAGGTGINSGAGSGTITLSGNAALNLSMTNTSMNNVISGGASSTINIAMGVGNLFLSNSVASQLNGFNGTLNVATTATNGGQLVIGTAAANMTINASTIWLIQAGAVVDFNVNQSNPGSVYLYGAPYTGATLGSLRLDDSIQSGPVTLMGNSQIGNGSAVGPSTISGTISDNGNGYGFTKPGANTIVLTAPNTYSGGTVINGGTLSLSGSGSINSSSNITIAAAATFDVSGLPSSTYTWSGSTSLSASGTGTASTNAATINGALGGTVSLASQPVSLTYKPSATNGDLTHPALYVSQGTLQLNNNVISVNNASAQALGVGTYTVIQDAAGSISGTPNATVNVTGSGLAAGTAASLSVSGGSVNLVVTTSAPPTHPVFNSFVRSGGNLILSGTNGPANGTYTVLSSTNAALAVHLWTPVSTNSFGPTGAFSVTNVITGNENFFIIQVP